MESITGSCVGMLSLVMPLAKSLATLLAWVLAWATYWAFRLYHGLRHQKWELLDYEVRPYDQWPMYSPMSQVRLVKIVPGRSKNTLSLTMKVVDLDYRPEYTALSYTWRHQRSVLLTVMRFLVDSLCLRVIGGEMPSRLTEPEGGLVADHVVVCDKVLLKLSKSLYQILKQLPPDIADRWLWIDAICIDQEDQFERFQQVSQMGRIYQYAKEVVVALGPLPSNGAQSLFVIDNISQPLSENSRGRIWPSMTPILRNSRLVHEGISFADRILRLPIAALRLATRSWFKRVWVIQEFRLARKVVFLYGKQQVSPNTLLFVCEWLRENMVRIHATNGFRGSRTCTGAIFQFFTAHIPSTHEMLQNYEQDVSHGYRWTLSEWYNACRGRRATVSKDYIYAGLGLVDPGLLSIDQTLGSKLDTRLMVHPRKGFRRGRALYVPRYPLTPNGLWSSLEPNYMASDAEVFVNAAACLLSHMSLGHLLQTAACLRSDENMIWTSLPEIPWTVQSLPSWAPSSGLSHSAMDSIGQNCCTQFTASTFLNDPATEVSRDDRNSKPNISSCGRYLTVQAAIVDRVQFVIIDDGLFQDKNQVLRLAQWLAQTTPSATSIQEKQCIFKHVACAMIGGQLGNDLITPDEAASRLCESLECRLLQMLRQSRLVILPMVSTARHILQNERQEEGYFRRVASILNALKLRFPHLPWSTPGVEDADLNLYEQHSTTPSKGKHLSSGPNTEASQLKPSLIQRVHKEAVAIRLKATSQWTNFYPSEEWNKPVSDQCLAFEEACTRNFLWRKLFYTTNGRVGLASKLVEVGDSVVLARDASTPFIFRPELDFLRKQKAILKAKLRILGTARSLNIFSSREATPEQRMMQARIVDIATRSYWITDGEEDPNRWVLVSDAYVAGVMHGELMPEAQFTSATIA